MGARETLLLTMSERAERPGPQESYAQFHAEAEEARIARENPVMPEAPVGEGALPFDALQAFAGAEPTPGEQATTGGAVGDNRAQYALDQNIQQGAELQGIADKVDPRLAQRQMQLGMSTPGQTDPGLIKSAARSKRASRGIQAKLKQNLEDRIGLTRTIAAKQDVKVALQADQAQLIADKSKDAAQLEAERNAEADAKVGAQVASIKQTVAELKEMKIDPKRAFSSLSNGERVAFKVGIALNGMLQGFMGKQETLSGVVNEIIDRDIAMQEKQFARKRSMLADERSLLGIVRNQFSDEAARREMTRSLQLGAAADMATAQLARMGEGDAKMLGEQQVLGLQQGALEAEARAAAAERAAVLKAIRSRQVDPLKALRYQAGLYDLRQKMMGGASQANIQKYGLKSAKDIASKEAIEGILGAMQQHGDPGIFARVMHGGITEWMVSDDDAVTLRKIQQMQNAMLAELSGAAVSVQEYERFEKGLQDKFTSPAVRKQLLLDMASKLEANLVNYAAAFGPGSRKGFEERRGQVLTQMPQQPKAASF